LPTGAGIGPGLLWRLRLAVFVVSISFFSSPLCFYCFRFRVSGLKNARTETCHPKPTKAWFSFQVSPFGKGGLRGIIQIISLKNLPSPLFAGCPRIVILRRQPKNLAFKRAEIMRFFAPLRMTKPAFFELSDSLFAKEGNTEGKCKYIINIS
jgi:hypothetical protein